MAQAGRLRAGSMWAQARLLARPARAFPVMLFVRNMVEACCSKAASCLPLRVLPAVCRAHGVLQAAAGYATCLFLASPGGAHHVSSIQLLSLHRCVCGL